MIGDELQRPALLLCIDRTDRGDRVRVALHRAGDMSAADPVHRHADGTRLDAQQLLVYLAGLLPALAVLDDGVEQIGAGLVDEADALLGEVDRITPKVPGLGLGVRGECAVLGHVGMLGHGRLLGDLLGVAEGVVPLDGPHVVGADVHRNIGTLHQPVVRVLDDDVRECVVHDGGLDGLIEAGAVHLTDRVER